MLKKQVLLTKKVHINLLQYTALMLLLMTIMKQLIRCLYNQQLNLIKLSSSQKKRINEDEYYEEAINLKKILIKS